MSVVADKIAGDMFPPCIPRFFLLLQVFMSAYALFFYFF